MARNLVRKKIKANDDYERSFTHTRPKPTVPPPAGRPSQPDNQNVGSGRPETSKKS